MDGFNRGTVLVNGCFDILTPGHTRLLTAASQRGKRVVVAVNTDESVARLKGAGRPIIPFDDRVAILRCIHGVNEVIGFNTELDLEKLVASLRPQYMVKGEDWKGKPITGLAQLESVGGSIVFVKPRQGEMSSSDIITRAAALA